MNEDGTMARTPELMEFVKEHNLKIITIADLIIIEKRQRSLVEAAAETKMPTKYGDFRAVWI